MSNFSKIDDNHSMEEQKLDLKEYVTTFIGQILIDEGTSTTHILHLSSDFAHR
jgi:hypothetical protein